MSESLIDPAAVLLPQATTADVFACQFSQWYPTFSGAALSSSSSSSLSSQNNHHDDRRRTRKRRTNVTIKSIVLSDDCIPSDEMTLLEAFLVSDGVQLPVGAERLSSGAAIPSSSATDDDDWSSDDDDDDDNKETKKDITADPPPPPVFHFPILNQELRKAMDSLGGSVIPKFNWSAPKDATWMNGHDMKCQEIGDVYLLCKSSDFCLHDVQRQAWKDCSDYDANSNHHNSIPSLQVTLRKWCNLHPSREFRCFVRQQELLAISQRNHTQHYPHLVTDAPKLQQLIHVFFEMYVQEQFGVNDDDDDTVLVPNYVFDVYIDQQERVWIVDFNIWAHSTDPLLFEWSELITLDMEEDSHMRVVMTSHQVRQDPLASYRAPIDTVNLASMTRGDTSEFEKFMKQCQKPSSSCS